MRSFDSYPQLAFVCLALMVSFFGTSTVIAQSGDDDSSFPYQAIVLKENATVHSGPGQAHYATDELKQGATVEVYRHDPGGWCAIRPTKGSFSLVPAETIELVDKGVGEIIESGTQAWVGTKLGAVEKPLWQVKLREGEQVDVLGEVSWPHPEGHSTVWYQISPPPGEFRWIRISDLQLPPARLKAEQARLVRIQQPARDTQTAGQVRSMLELPAAKVDTRIDAAVQPTSLVTQATLASPAIKTDSMNLGWRRSTRPIPSAATDTPRNDRIANNSIRNGPITRVASLESKAGFQIGHQPASSTNSSPVNRLNNNPPAARLADARLDSRLTTIAPARPISSGSTGSDRLLDLEMELTNELVKHPSQWQFDSLLATAELIHDSTTFPDERVRAARMIEKCRKGVQVQSGYQNVYRNQGPDAFPDSKLRNTPAIGSGVVTEEVGLGTTYDAYGWLNELVRQQGSLQSTYVLQDGNGKITHHISPSPGLNLHRYLKSKIGIIGQQGFDHRLNLKHVVADRVVVLEKAK